MNNLTKAFSYLIAAQFQAVALILAAWWVGEWLNEHHPIDVTWYAITFPVGVVGVAHSFYMVIRAVIQQSKKQDAKKAAEKK